MHEPVVSVLLSVNRDRGGLEASIDSALEQSLAALELIIIDDGAPASVRETLRRKQAADPRVHTIENECLTRSLNRGLGQARGRYIARIDEGDLWRPTKLESRSTSRGTTGLRPDWYTVSRLLRPQPPRSQWDPAAHRRPGHPPVAVQRPHALPTPLDRVPEGVARVYDAAKTSQDFELYLRLSLIGKLHNPPRSSCCTTVRTTA
jgi:glycosyltransferase involved in cell wall biosynthesis